MEDSARQDGQPMLRAAAIAAVLGGLLCALTAVVHSLEPVGCIGLECEARAMRTMTPLVTALGAAASLFILLGMAGLLVMAWRTGRHTKLAGAGPITALAGFAILLAGFVVQEVFFGGDSPWMPVFVLPGVLAVIAGFVVIGIFIILAGILPKWLGIVLVASSLLLIGANEQTAAVLLAIPFGLAVATVGFFMWSAANRAPEAVPAER